MNQNKTSKYFKYAIGEIILVVIGILIALQINNWNEKVKKNKLRTSYINALMVDYSKDIMQLNASLEFNKEALKAIDSMHASLYSDDIKLENFLSYFTNFERTVRTQNNFNTNSFNVLISSGNIDLLNANLVEALMELNRLQTSQTTITNKNQDTYITLMSNSAMEFPIFSESYNYSEPANALLWKTVDLEKIPLLVGNILLFKRYVLRRYLELAEVTKSKTDTVLVLLNSRLKND